MEFILYIMLTMVCLLPQTYAQEYVTDGCNPPELETPGSCIITFRCINRVNNDIRTYTDGDCDDFINFPSSVGYRPVNIILTTTDTQNEIPEINSYMIDCVYSLDLRNNDYTFVPTLTQMQNMQKLQLSMNAITTAKLSNRNDLPALMDLDYSHNTIDGIEVIPDEFQYTKLKFLNISHNYLVKIPEAIFVSFSELESLDFSHNYIDSLTMMTFEGLRKLLHLYLSNNRITEINSSLLRFNDLITLDLNHNYIQTLKKSDFNKLLNLKYLYLNSNDIYFAETNVFNSMTSLITIDLSNNDMDSIDQNLFLNATDLISVHLSKNKLKSLPRNMFKGKRLLSFTIEGNELEGVLEQGCFEGLTMIRILDLSRQHLISVTNYAFAGLQNLKTLLLNNNDLHTLHNYAFKGLPSLDVLDISHNKIIKIDFVMEDLVSLQMLSLHHNKINQISSDSFIAMTSLQILDLSHNNISHLEPNSFKSLQSLTSLKISDNPLSGPLIEKTFDGLNSIPSLDISGSLITKLNNGSFTGTTNLLEVNVSHSKIAELEFNALSFLYNIQTIDLSYNELSTFEVNTTDLTDIRTIILNNNLLQVISPTSFAKLNFLSKIILSYNHIRNLSKETFNALDELRYLDLSYNRDLKFDVSLVEKAPNLKTILISGVKSDMTFEIMTDVPLTVLEIAHSDIQNITRLNLKGLERLESLVLSNNAVPKLEVGALSNLTALKQLDLSFNNLTFIQPGAFKDNIYLNLLNISHNKLVEINYGIFRGLIYLETMDLSYNSIKSLHQGRFYEVEHLKMLIADHNEIDFISPEEFTGTHLSTLSIGGNPLPCDILVGLKKAGFVEFTITALKIDETNENVDGVTCNKDSDGVRIKPTSASGEREKLLLDIRDILYNVSKGQMVKEKLVTMPNDSSYLANLTEQQQKLNQYTLNTFRISISNLTSGLAAINNNTNSLLEQILRVLSSKDSVETSTVKPISIVKQNASSDNLIPYINKIKRELEDTITVEKQNILMELHNKIEKINSRLDSSLLTTIIPVHDKLIASEEKTQKSPMFTEICVGLILVIIVGYMLVKLYKSKWYMPSSRSLNCSTRHIADAMESSHL